MAVGSVAPHADQVRSARLVLPSSPLSVSQSTLTNVPARANTVAETRWGLGLKHIQDLPLEDIYNFGLVSQLPIPPDHHNCCDLETLTTLAAPIHGRSIVSTPRRPAAQGPKVGKRIHKANPLITATSRASSASSSPSSSRTSASCPSASCDTPSTPSSRSASCSTSPSSSSKSTSASPPAGNGIPPSSRGLACPACPSTPRWLQSPSSST